MCSQDPGDESPKNLDYIIEVPHWSSQLCLKSYGPGRAGLKIAGRAGPKEYLRAGLGQQNFMVFKYNSFVKTHEFKILRAGRAERIFTGRAGQGRAENFFAGRAGPGTGRPVDTSGNDRFLSLQNYKK